MANVTRCYLVWIVCGVRVFTHILPTLRSLLAVFGRTLMLLKIEFESLRGRH